MTRPLDTATAAAFQTSDLPLAFIVRLDILSDPLLIWSGLSDLVIGASAYGDTALDGATYTGTGNLVQIGNITDSLGGSDALEISLPGVDLTMPALKQLIYNRNRWQFRQAWVWMMVLDPVTYAIVGKPFRVFTGRMDQMPYSETKAGGVVKCRIEGQQSYGEQPSLTRYSENISTVNSSDVSQNYVYSLANMTASLGTPSAKPTTTYPGGGYLGGGYRFL